MEEEQEQLRKPARPREKHSFGISVQLLVAAVLCALTLGAKLWYPQAAQTLRPWVIGQEDNRVMQAFSALSQTMEQGASVGKGVQAFYMEMTDEGVS